MRHLPYYICRHLLFVGIIAFAMSESQTTNAATELTAQQVWDTAHSNMQRIKTYKGTTSNKQVQGVSLPVMYTYFMRNNSDGTREEVTIKSNDKTSITNHVNANGNWSVGAHGLFIKNEIEDYDILEARCAVTVTANNTFEFLEPRMIDGNEAFVVLRRASPELFKNMISETRKQRERDAVTDPKHASSYLDSVEGSVPLEKIVFVRKKDLLIHGYQLRSQHQSLIKERMCTAFETDIHLEESVFSLPNTDYKTIKTVADTRQAIAQAVGASIIQAQAEKKKQGSDGKPSQTKSRQSKLPWIVAGALTTVFLLWMLGRSKAART